jgi:hypothetical protein
MFFLLLLILLFYYRYHQLLVPGEPLDPDAAGLELPDRRAQPRPENIRTEKVGDLCHSRPVRRARRAGRW